MGSTYGDGIAAGVNSGIQHLQGFMRQKTYGDYAEMEKRKQLAAEAQMKGELAAGSSPVGANALARPQAAPSFVPASAENYSTPTVMGEVGPQPKPEQKWNPMGEVGADALVAPKARPVAGPPQDAGEIPLDELQELSYAYGQKSKEGALSNANDIDSLRAAYHYKAQMGLAKPYLDKWADALQEVRANPQTPDKWRKAMALTGEDDPARALSLATGEYSKLRQQYDTFSSSYGPLNEYLTSRGITPEMYGDESKFLQFMNQMQFKPHSPRKGALPGASMLGRKPPMPRR